MAAFFKKKLKNFTGQKRKTGRVRIWRRFWSIMIPANMRHRAVPQMR
mgnify:CR=1 FL=1